MTSQSILSEFNLYYDNLASHLAPGLDEYEISVYLTRAYGQFVDAWYSQYEQNEKARRKLAPLVKTQVLHSDVCNIPKTTNKSQFFRLNNDVKYIVYEHLTYSNNADKCLRNKTIPVIPVTHDDFSRVYRDPFKFNNNKALRLDISDSADNKYVEVISSDSHIDNYFIRYIQTPGPIIIKKLTGNDYINGKQDETVCPLDDISIREIIELAAQLAYADYKNVQS